ncbi:response regulator [Streptomyces bathyalis]|uniref:Response regulator n=1 Tax=Streptomyces bathyalis TaxID=2710756 RepID=A0A7T1WSW8_9ACTN|nr:P-loop NTPase fold protein [Streptomyces bathyalis]QPP06205.1 response regulator [Streptomyces bathyalis]
MAGIDPQQFSLINDEPVTDGQADLLGARGPAAQLARLLVDSRSSTPLTLAVDSGWGTGKSSLMRLVDLELTQTHGVRTVWYNAWTSTGADILEGLIKSVLLRFDKRVLRRTVQRVSDHGTVLKLIRASFLLVAGMFGLSPLVNELWKGLSVSPQARNEMRDAIRDAVKERVEAGEFAPEQLLVVFIDDLDRCSEETVLAVCEAVKVYLDVPGLVFVIGCDRSALASNGLLRDLSPAGSAFMEKIFQTTYRIPVPDGTGIEKFIDRCAKQSGIQVVLNADLISLIAERSGRNPRRIKKLINGFVLEVGLNPLWQDFVREDARSVISTLVLQHFYPDFYRMLVSSSDAGGDYGDVLTEFQMYRKVRLRLRLRPRQVEDGMASDEEVAGFFAQHLVRQPSLADMDSWKENLEELEQELPREFPDLVTDSGFTSLVDDLERQPRYEELIQRIRQRPSQIEDLEQPQAYEQVIQQLRQQPLPSTAEQTVGVPSQQYQYQPPPQYQLPQYQAPQYGAPPLADLPGARVPQPLADMSILWIDDNPASVELDVSAMRRAGAYVEVVEDRTEAERHLAAGDHDLLISDITRGTDREAGFKDVEGLRHGGFYTGPVIFFTGRVTPAREARAQQLEAEITAGPDKLQQLVARAAQERRSRGSSASSAVAPGDSSA